MPIRFRSESLFSVTRLYRWLKEKISGRGPPPEPSRFRPPSHENCRCRFTDLDKLLDKETLYLVNLPGANQEEVQDMIETLRNVFEPKAESIVMILGHKNVHLIVQGKGKCKSIIIKLHRYYGFKFRKNENEQD